VLANNVTLQGGSSTGAGAQIGFDPVAAGNNTGTFGATISVTALGNVSVLAGTATGAFAQIGNGGYNAFRSAPGGTGTASLTGDILVHAGGSVLLQAGLSTNKAAFAQIGNGGYGAGLAATISNSSGLTVGGSITVTAGTNISVLGGSGPDNYA